MRSARVLEFNRVSKRFGDVDALTTVSMTVAADRTTVLIGPSGCGKSTLLRLAVGLLLPDSGSVSMDGQVLAAENLPAVRLRIGYVIQEGGLFPHLNAGANVALMARHLDWDTARIGRRVAELAELVQLPEALLEHYPAELSGGQRQRAGLMRALMLDPDLLLLDEPLAALDPMIRFELQQDLKRIFARLHKTVLLVTHDLSEAGFFSDHLVLMRAGRIVQQGSATNLLDTPANEFVRQFISAQRLPFADRQA